MKIRAIFACDEKGGIGKNGTIPWPPNMLDLKWFKESTNEQTVVMGRKTWEDPKMLRPLPNRTNIVVAKRKISEGADMQIIQYNDLERYLRPSDIDVWIIGGATLLKNSLHFVDEIWLSRIEGDFSCNTVLPIAEINEEFNKFEDYQKFETFGKLHIEKYRKI